MGAVNMVTDGATTRIFPSNYRILELFSKFTIRIRTLKARLDGYNVMIIWVNYKFIYIACDTMDLQWSLCAILRTR